MKHKTITYILNRVPTKAATKTQLWISRKPSLKHCHVWGCRTEVWPYKPNENTLEPKTMSSYFINYTERLKGFKFYDPILRNIFETGTVTFFEDIELGERNKIKGFVFEEELVSLPKLIHTIVPTLIQDKRLFLEEQTQHPQHVSFR